ncbi:hypothetical protein JW872_01780 [Candidatus Babeliales bacterium]|nr:hypothetical protein [Candidatus Babeliales bacterium]
MKRFVRYTTFILGCSTLCVEDNHDLPSISEEQFLQMLHEYQQTGIIPISETTNSSDSSAEQPKTNNKEAMIFCSTIARMLTGFGVAVATRDPAKIIGGICSIIAAGLELVVKSHRPDLAEQYEATKATRSPQTPQQELMRKLRYYLGCVKIMQPQNN